MLYKKDERVVLRTDLENEEWFGSMVWRDVYDYGGADGVVIEDVDESDCTYLLKSGFWIAEDMIDHEATSTLVFKELLDSLSEPEPNNPWEGPFEAEGVPEDSLSLTIKIKGAKAYREKLEELHSQIEAVEHTIEQLNDMDMTIEVEDD